MFSMVLNLTFWVQIVNVPFYNEVNVSMKKNKNSAQ